MKQAGIIILVIGILLTIFAGYNVVTQKKVVQIGKLEITKDENHIMDWSPLAGVVVIVIGGGMFFYGMKKQ